MSANEQPRPITRYPHSLCVDDLPLSLPMRMTLQLKQTEARRQARNYNKQIVAQMKKFEEVRRQSEKHIKELAERMESRWSEDDIDSCVATMGDTNTGADSDSSGKTITMIANTFLAVRMQKSSLKPRLVALEDLNTAEKFATAVYDAVNANPLSHLRANIRYPWIYQDFRIELTEKYGLDSDFLVMLKMIGKDPDNSTYRVIQLELVEED